MAVRVGVCGVVLLLLIDKTYPDVTSLFYPFGMMASDANMTSSDVDSDDAHVVDLGFTFRWFSNSTPYTQLKISKHGQVSFDTSWNPALSKDVNLASSAEPPLVAILADNYASFEHGEVYFRSSVAVGDLDRASGDVHRVSRTLMSDTISNVVIVTWNDTGPDSAIKGNSFQLVLMQTDTGTVTYAMFLYWRVHLDAGMKAGLRSATTVYSFPTLDGMALQSNIGRPGMWFFRTSLTSLDIHPPVDAAWKTWQLWGPCSVSCDGGTQARNRTCESAHAQLGGSPVCDGAETETRNCSMNDCMDSWMAWSDWTACSITCGGGLRNRTHECNGTKCEGWTVNYQTCNEMECPVDGVWTAWEQWTTCSATCGNGGTRARLRSCVGQRAGGATCAGTTTEYGSCAGPLLPCPVHGGWSIWAGWAACGALCGGGVRRRIRMCDNPTPIHNGEQCYGTNEEHDTCNEQLCEVTKKVNGFWTPWKPGSCSVTCGAGTVTRTRICANPQPAHGGENCTGDSNDVQPCPTQPPCPEDGNWGWWNVWGPCNSKCASGRRTRYRYCDNPPPAHGGLLCSVVLEQEVIVNLQHREGFIQFQGGDCNMQACPPIHGEWGPWEQTAPCSATCDGGRKQMTRHCDAPYPKNGGRPCTGGDDLAYDLELFSCNYNPCPRHGFWTVWGSWSDCSLTCSDGIETRTRDCNQPAFGGYNCEGETLETRHCNWGICHINGSWGNWTAWSDCSVSCAGGVTTRKRSCDNPAPNGNGTECNGMNEEQKTCMTQVCPPLDGHWSPWTMWSECSESCGSHGHQTQARHCTNPRPLRAGLPCKGNDYIRVKVCNRHACKEDLTFRDGEWGIWTAWSPCPVTCGHGMIRRLRTCDDPPPIGDGSVCRLTIPVSHKYPVKGSEVMVCALSPCPVDVFWGQWDEWSACSSSCGDAQRRRVRHCESPSPTNGGQPCQGGSFYTDIQEQSVQCDVHVCPDGSHIVNPAHFAPGFNALAKSCRFEQLPGSNFWPHTNVGQTVRRPCPKNTVGNMTRLCLRDDTWDEADKSECVTASFKDLIQLDVAALQRDLINLEQVIAQFVNTCRADEMKVHTDLIMCCERFRLLVEVEVLYIEEIMLDKRTVFYKDISQAGNELLAARNKVLWDEIVSDEVYSETSLVLDTARQFERLGHQMAVYLFNTRQPAYMDALTNVVLNIEPVECYLKGYTFPQSNTKTHISLPPDALSCDPEPEAMQPTVNVKVTTRTTTRSMTPSETSLNMTQDTNAMTSISDITMTSLSMTTGVPAVGRRWRRASDEPVYYVMSLQYTTLDLFLPTETRGAYKAPSPYKDSRTGVSDYKAQRMVAARPIYSTVLTSRGTRTKLVINFKHTMDGRDPQCAYLKNGVGQTLYSSIGCVVQAAGDDFTVCECPGDAGTFLLLLTPKDTTKYRTPWDPIFYIALTIGFIAHLVIFIIYMVLRLVHLDRHFMTVNFLAAFTAAQLVALVSVTAVNSNEACWMMAWFVHFLLLATMFWVLCIAGYSFTEVSSSRPIGWCRRLLYAGVGWGTPVFISIITISLYSGNLERTFFCWYPYDEIIFTAYGLPLGIIALSVCYTSIIVHHQLIDSPQFLSRVPIASRLSMTGAILIVAFVRKSPATNRAEDTFALNDTEPKERYTDRTRYLIFTLVLLAVVALNLVMFGIPIPIAFIAANILQAIFDVILFLIIDPEAFERLVKCCHGMPEDGGTVSRQLTPADPEPEHSATPLFDPVRDAWTPTTEKWQDGGLGVFLAEAQKEDGRRSSIPGPAEYIKWPYFETDVKVVSEEQPKENGNEPKEENEENDKEKETKEMTEKTEKKDGKEAKRKKGEKEKKEKKDEKGKKEEKDKDQKEKKSKEEKGKKAKKKKAKSDDADIPPVTVVAATSDAAEEDPVEEVKVEEVEELKVEEIEEEETIEKTPDNEPEPEVAPEAQKSTESTKEDPSPEGNIPADNPLSTEELLRAEISEMEEDEASPAEPAKEEQAPPSPEETLEKVQTPKPVEKKEDVKPIRVTSSVSRITPVSPMPKSPEKEEAKPPQRMKSSDSHVLDVPDAGPEVPHESASKVVIVKHS